MMRMWVVEMEQKMEVMALKNLPPFEFGLYKTKSRSWFQRPTRIRSVHLKLPFGNLRGVQRTALAELRRGL